MPIPPGSRLGPYESIAPLGAGGMGAVFHARDTRLGRAVAIKVILETFASDPERVARFEREARMLASLHHPRIASLFGMEQDDGRHVLVMELVEGETIADRLRRGAMPAEEAVAIAVQIAEALEAAYERGVVHRDLKPANVKVTADHQVKVLDFGLAKAMEAGANPADVANSPNDGRRPAPSLVAARREDTLCDGASWRRRRDTGGERSDRGPEIEAAR